MELYTDDTYEYRAIATNIKHLNNSEIVHEYNQRGEHSENRIKELKSDFAAGRPPCSDFAANALYVCVCALSYNVFALMRFGLPVGLRRGRAPRLRQRVFGLAAKIVRRGSSMATQTTTRASQLVSPSFQKSSRYHRAGIAASKNPLVKLRAATELLTLINRSRISGDS